MGRKGRSPPRGRADFNAVEQAFDALRAGVVPDAAVLAAACATFHPASASVRFSPSLTAVERRTVHGIAARKQVFHRSVGEGAERCLEACAAPFTSPDASPATAAAAADALAVAADNAEAEAAGMATGDCVPCKPQLRFLRSANNFLDPGYDPVHPAEEQVLRLVQRPPDALLRALERFAQQGPPAPLRVADVRWVDTPAALQALATELLRAAFFAVDLELHSMRSYHGFTCLLQVSVPAREDMGSSEVTDYVVDVLALWEHMALLKPAFEEPGVLKVFHAMAGADVRALHRDFGVFVVNAFDTMEAARLLDMRLGLAHLLVQVVGLPEDEVTASKAAYQTADWRLRPLPEPMLAYASSDTHYLLHVAGRLITALRTGEPPAPPRAAAELPAGPPAPLDSLLLASVSESASASPSSPALHASAASPTGAGGAEEADLAGSYVLPARASERVPAVRAGAAAGGAGRRAALSGSEDSFVLAGGSDEERAPLEASAAAAAGTAASTSADAAAASAAAAAGTATTSTADTAAASAAAASAAAASAAAAATTAATAAATAATAATAAFASAASASASASAASASVAASAKLLRDMQRALPPPVDALDAAAGVLFGGDSDYDTGSPAPAPPRNSRAQRSPARRGHAVAGAGSAAAEVATGLGAVRVRPPPPAAGIDAAAHAAPAAASAADAADVAYVTDTADVTDASACSDAPSDAASDADQAPPRSPVSFAAPASPVGRAPGVGLGALTPSPQPSPSRSGSRRTARTGGRRTYRHAPRSQLEQSVQRATEAAAECAQQEAVAAEEREVRAAYRASQITTLCLWRPKRLPANAHEKDKAYQMMGRSLSAPQKRLFQALFQWRDFVARVEDESKHYVCSTRILMAITRLAPRSLDQLQTVFSPLPPLIAASLPWATASGARGAMRVRGHAKPGPLYAQQVVDIVCEIMPPPVESAAAVAPAAGVPVPSPVAATDAVATAAAAAATNAAAVAGAANAAAAAAVAPAPASPVAAAPSLSTLERRLRVLMLACTLGAVSVAAEALRKVCV